MPFPLFSTALYHGVESTAFYFFRHNIGILFPLPSTILYRTAESTIP
jgi:hypothetical protein